MDDHRVPLSRRAVHRAVGLAALACTITVLGCTKSPLAWTLDFAPSVVVAGRSAAPGTASAMPSASPGATAVPTIGTTAAPGSPASATATPDAVVSEPIEAIDPDDPLPAASTSSDLAPAEQTAVEQALREDVLPYLGSELIHDGGVVLLTHDGGVVLYRTLAAGGDVRRQTNPVPVAPGPAPIWGRTEEAHSDTLLTLRKDCADGDCAEGVRPVRATIRYQQKGKFSYKGPGEVVEKRFGALFSRSMVLVPKDGKYQLAQLAPIEVITKGGRRGLEIARVSIFRQGTVDKVGPPAHVLIPDRAMVKVGDQPFAIGGERIRLEVDLASRDPGAPFVFAALQGAKATARVQFFDDGRGVDRVAGDHRYSGEVTTANRPGVQHVLFDVVEPRSFLPNGQFRAYTVGIGFRVEVREGPASTSGR